MKRLLQAFDAGEFDAPMIFLAVVFALTLAVMLARTGWL